LAQAVAGLIGPGTNWCALATWASKQAGQSIRKEDLRRALQRRLRSSAEATDAAQTLVGADQRTASPEAFSVTGALDAIWDALSPAAAFERTSEAVARGNLKVFEEIGFQYARFLDTFADGQPDEAKLAVFCEGIQPGDPPEGQGCLRLAFTHYHQSWAAGDERSKAEFMYLANLEIGFHEQTRLQPEIVDALHAPIYDPRRLRRRLMDQILPNPTARLRHALARLSGRARPIIQARDDLAGEAMRIARLIVTERMMTLTMPDDQALQMGQDLQGSFPEVLRTLELPDLRALLDRIDPTPDSLLDTGAYDWGNLPDRMHFIADLFRIYHSDARLFNPPYSPEQIAQLKSGRLPEGSL
jgi:hypothetical protein